MIEHEQPIAQGRTAEIFAWNEGRVLKLFRAGFTRQSCDHEFNIAQAISRSGVPAPIAFEQIEVDGRHGIVYERVEGQTMLRELTAHPERLVELAQLMADLHAQVHQHKAHGLPRSRDKFEWLLEQAPLSDAQKSEIARRAAALPDDDCVCHGDFHPDNILLTPAGPRVIDWNNANSGNPMADIAWTSLILRKGEAPPGSEAQVAEIQTMRIKFHDVYLQRRLALIPDAQQQLNNWLLPVMLARLADNIAEERENLLRMIDQALNA